MAKLRWTEKASKNLQSIHEYIARDSKIYAGRFVKSLILATRKLEKLPQCGRIVPELESHGLREVIYGNYRIVYRYLRESKEVQVLAIVHGARDIRRVLREEWLL